MKRSPQVARLCRSCWWFNIGHQAGITRDDIPGPKGGHRTQEWWKPPPAQGWGSRGASRQQSAAGVTWTAPSKPFRGWIRAVALRRIATDFASWRRPHHAKEKPEQPWKWWWNSGMASLQKLISRVWFPYYRHQVGCSETVHPRNLKGFTTKTIFALDSCIVQPPSADPFIHSPSSISNHHHNRS